MQKDYNIKSIIIFQTAEKLLQQQNKNSMPQKEIITTPRKTLQNSKYKIQ